MAEPPLSSSKDPPLSPSLSPSPAPTPSPSHHPLYSRPPPLLPLETSLLQSFSPPAMAALMELVSPSSHTLPPRSPSPSSSPSPSPSPSIDRGTVQSAWAVQSGSRKVVKLLPQEASKEMLKPYGFLEELPTEIFENIVDSDLGFEFLLGLSDEDSKLCIKKVKHEVLRFGILSHYPKKSQVFGTIGDEPWYIALSPSTLISEPSHSDEKTKRVPSTPIAATDQKAERESHFEKLSSLEFFKSKITNLTVWNWTPPNETIPSSPIGDSSVPCVNNSVSVSPTSQLSPLSPLSPLPWKIISHEVNGDTQKTVVMKSKSGHLYSTPRAEDIVVFQLKGVFLKLDPGVWHTGPFFTSPEGRDFYTVDMSDTNVSNRTNYSFTRREGVVFDIDLPESVNGMRRRHSDILLSLKDPTYLELLTSPKS